MIHKFTRNSGQNQEKVTIFAAKITHLYLATLDFCYFF